MAHLEIDEYLEMLYHLRERHQVDLKTLKEHQPDFEERVLNDLQTQGLLKIDGEKMQLTEVGFQRAERIVRRHRLAERLLTDVLHMSAADVEKAACEYEHMVADEITESICILLGHPRSCPHGSPIPEGSCCRSAAKETESAVMPLTEAPVGKWVRVAYVVSTSDERQHRLSHFGIAPGSTIKVHQFRPAVVVMHEERRIAMEEAIARDIFVWKKEVDTSSINAGDAGSLSAHSN
jgi:DtxR family Mn-dependent transcriptional regulator